VCGASRRQNLKGHGFNCWAWFEDDCQCHYSQLCPSLSSLRPVGNQQLPAAGATPAGDDLSIFYGDDVEALTTVTDRRRFLPSDLYRRLVQDSVVCCVDVLLVRRNPETRRKECLLVHRATEPVKVSSGGCNVHRQSAVSFAML